MTLTLLPQEEFTETEKRILAEVDESEKFFVERSRTHPNEDHSKHWLILAYNLYDIGLPTRARKMFMKCRWTYMSSITGLDADIITAINCRFKLVRDEATEIEESESELVYVMQFIMPHIEKDETLEPRYEEMKKILDKYGLYLTPEEVEQRRDVDNDEGE